jgi:cohesin complex subunit SA-1/2
VEGSNKRKREDSDTESDKGSELTEIDDIPDHEEDIGDEFKLAKAKQKGKAKAKPKAAGPSKKKDTSSPKKARTAKGPVAKPSKPTTRKPRKAKGGDTFDIEKVAKDSKIAGDNPLFSPP